MARGAGIIQLMTDRILLWTTFEPRGFSVSLASDVWEHIVADHSEFAPYFDTIQSTVEHPDEIYFDAKSTDKRNTGSQIYAYYRARLLSGEFEDDMVYVSVKFVQEDIELQGYVQTAFSTNRVQKRMRRVWKK